MSEKNLKYLFSAVVLLFLIWGAVSLFSGRGNADETPPALSEIFSGPLEGRVDTVRIQSPDDSGSIVIERSDGRWKVNGFRADSATLARFWEALSESTVGDLVAANPANHSRMGVSADSAWVLELSFPDHTRSVLIGNAGPSFGTAYIRLPEAREVFLLRGNLRSQVTRGLEGWRNKTLARVDTARVQVVEVRRDGDQIRLTRADSLWLLEDETAAGSSAVRFLLGETARLDASGFFSSSDTLTAQAGALYLLNSTGDTLLDLRIGAGEGDRWARVAGDSITYRLPSWRIGRLLPERASLTGDG